jgi:hypothetical protein
LAWDEPPKGDDLKAVPRRRFLNCLSAQRFSRRWVRNLRAALRPLGFPLPMVKEKMYQFMLFKVKSKRICGEVDMFENLESFECQVLRYK